MRRNTLYSAQPNNRSAAANSPIAIVIGNICVRLQVDSVAATFYRTIETHASLIAGRPDISGNFLASFKKTRKKKKQENLNKKSFPRIA